jgi:glycosyltransferase involved in cell wall biosynthesis
MQPVLTIGMATYKDYDGVYFTLQSLRLHQDLDGVELLVVDNFGCDATRQLVESWTGGRYLRYTDVTGPAGAKDRVFREARGKAVLCIDSHVLLVGGVVARLKRYYRDHPRTGDLLQGPLLYDDLRTVASHFDPVWSGGMWGVWAIDPRTLRPRSQPFEIPMQGLGLFSCRKAAWPGFNPHFRGFGGEEGYLHQKFRNRGRRCLCLPWLRWVHRFGRPDGPPYPLDWRDRIVNYLVGHRELHLDETPVLEHFRPIVGPQVLAQAQAEADHISPPARARTTATVNGSARARGPELVSCLMPTYNRAPHNLTLLEEAVESFLRQDYPHKELLILNDTPGQTLECTAPGVTVFNRAQRFSDVGAKVAWLIEHAHGDVYCRWDDDDISLPWRIRLSLERLGSRPTWRPTTYWFDDGRLRFPESSGYCHVQGIFRTAMLKRIGGYPAGYGAEDAEDALFSSAAARCGLDHAEELAPEEHFYIYRWNTGSVHVSGLGPPGRAWRARGQEPITPGTYSIEPRWQRNYVNDCRQALAPVRGESWESVAGHFDFAPLYQSALATMPFGAAMVEVGCWHGRSLIFLAQAARGAGKRLRIYGVENGTGIDAEALPIDTLRGNLASCGVAGDVRLLVMDSVEAAATFADESLRFVFIDAAHDYHNVRTDVQAWWPKICPGGLLAGHDYTDCFPEVAQAVDGYFGVAPGTLRSPHSASCWQRSKSD